MRAWKLLRLRRDGTLGPLFVGRKNVLEPWKWYAARDDLPHPGLAYRPGFHCCRRPEAPPLKLLLKSGERRVWCRVFVSGVERVARPSGQGGLWLVARSMMIDYVAKERTADAS